MGVFLMVTHRDTTSCFTKICKVSRKKSMLTSLYQGKKTLVKHYNNKIFCVRKKSVFFVVVIFHFGNLRRVFSYHFLISSNKMLSKSNTFMVISIFLLKVKTLYATFCIKYLKAYNIIYNIGSVQTMFSLCVTPWFSVSYSHIFKLLFFIENISISHTFSS